jgi:hypothetical protein
MAQMGSRRKEEEWKEEVKEELPYFFSHWDGVTRGREIRERAKSAVEALLNTDNCRIMADEVWPLGVRCVSSSGW